MQLTVEQIEKDLKKVYLTGRMDIEGTEKIDLPFTRATTLEKAWIIVDLSGVNFMASIGLRTIMTCAKALSIKGGKMVLCSPQPMVSDVLKTTKIDTVIPVFDNLNEAIRFLKT